MDEIEFLIFGTSEEQFQSLVHVLGERAEL